MQNTAKMTYYYSPNKIAIKQNKTKEKLTIQIACKDSKQLEHTLFMDMENGASTVAKSLDVFHNVKHTFSLCPRSCTYS